MGKILICYKFKEMKLSKRNEFRRSLFGTIEKTHRGKYTVIIKGVLSDKEYEKPVNSVVIINQKDKELVIAVLNKFNAEIKVYKIV